MKVTESRSGTRCTLTTGESVVLLRLKEQQKGIWLVEELKLDRTQTETVLQEAMQAVGDFLRRQKDAAAAGVPVGTELVCPIPAAGPAGAEGQDKARLLIEGHTAGRLYYRCGQSSCSAAACTYSCAADCR